MLAVRAQPDSWFAYRWLADLASIVHQSEELGQAGEAAGRLPELFGLTEIDLQLAP